MRGTGGIESIGNEDCSEDGHPAEAALEMRRILIVSGNAEEVPADVLDLAVSVAWIGKAVSRTVAIRELLVDGVDPNSWQVVGYAIASDAVLARLLETASNGKSAHGMGASLASIRESLAFRTACASLEAALARGGGPARRRLEALRHLLSVAQDDGCPAVDAAVIDFSAARRRIEALRGAGV